MATTLDQIADLFLAKIQDYKITTLLQTSGSEAVCGANALWIRRLN